VAVPISYNLRNLLERKGTTLMTAFGIGLTVAVLVTSLALKKGLDTVFGGSGDPRHVVVLRKGTSAELTSSVSTEAYQIIRRLPGISADTHGEPMVSPEILTVVNLPSVDSPEGMNVTVRGMLPVGLEMREIVLDKGRMFRPGLRELIVGDAIARRYPDAQIGKKLHFGRGNWEVVGIFHVGESTANSEAWVDLNQLAGDFERQGSSSSILITSDNQMARDALIKTIGDDQRLGSNSMGEREYYASITDAGAAIKGLGFAVAIIMAVGSAFAATNTMYAAVSRRTREIGTLRALGFGRGAILLSFVFESVCLSLIGGLVGVLLALPINGMNSAVGSFVTFSETAFKFRIGLDSIVYGLIFAAVIGALGGFLPAWSASKKGIVAAMRDL
jgi:ABC-type lipoprotein release transport system permease subunit